MLYFLGGKSCDAFVQPTFFQAGNRARNQLSSKCMQHLETCSLTAEPHRVLCHLMMF